MAFEKSTANGYLDLLERLRKHLTNTSDGVWTASTAYNLGDIIEPTTANGYRYECVTAGTSGTTEPTWTTNIGDQIVDGGVTWQCISSKLPSAQVYIEKLKTYDDVNNVDGDLVLEGKGLDGTKSFHIAFRTFNDSVNNIWNWKLYMFKTYDSNVDITGQIGVNYSAPVFSLYDQQIPYWIFSSGERVVLIANVSTYYMSMYIGRFYPYLPNYDECYLIGGSYYQDIAYSDTNNAGFFTFMRNSNLSNTYCKLPNGSWAYGYVDTNYSWLLGSAYNKEIAFYPYMDTTYNLTFNNNQFLHPLIIIAKTYNGNINPNHRAQLIGELIDCFYITNRNVTSEDIIVIGTDNYHVFQDADYSGKYIAVKEVL